MQRKNLSSAVWTRRNIAGSMIMLFIIAGFFAYSFRSTRSTLPISDSITAEYNALTTPMAKKLYLEQSEGLTKHVDPRFRELDMLTIGCFGPSQVLLMDDNDKNLGGQCCGVLKSTHLYEEQLESLETYRDIPEIPKDPYSVPVALAQKLLRYDQEITLTSEQQKVFDKASAMSNEGGPCCCKCWKWYVYSGLAKYLITNYQYTAEQVAEVWDISDNCGEHGGHHSGVLKHDKHEE